MFIRQIVVIHSRARRSRRRHGAGDVAGVVSFQRVWRNVRLSKYDTLKWKLHNASVVKRTNFCCFSAAVAANDSIPSKIEIWTAAARPKLQFQKKITIKKKTNKK